jgi:hypothetical protein
MQDTPVFITLAVEKDAETNHIQLHVVFHHDANNIELTKATTTWAPTTEELEFLNEAFCLIPVQHSTEPSQPKAKPEHHLTDDEDPSIRHSVTEEEIHAAVVSKKRGAEQDPVLVQVDEKIIEEVIQRRKPAETLDKTETLVDRLTKKKKTG